MGYGGFGREIGAKRRKSGDIRENLFCGVDGLGAMAENVCLFVFFPTLFCCFSNCCVVLRHP
jgi:hypothetical protein